MGSTTVNMMGDLAGTLWGVVRSEGLLPTEAEEIDELDDAESV